MIGVAAILAVAVFICGFGYVVAVLLPGPRGGL